MTAKNTSFHADHMPEGQSAAQLFDVDKLVRDPANANGRFDGHDESEVRELALDILSTSMPGAGNRPFFHGQKHAITCERDSEGRPFVVAGFGRCGAIDWINANVDDADVKSHLERLNLLGADGALIKPFPILVKMAPAMTAQDRVLYNLGENAMRKPLSPMDWAVVIQKFVAQGLTDAQIVELLKKYKPTGKAGELHTTWIGQHRALLALSPELQRRVHTGEVPVHQAGVILRNAKEMTLEDGSKLTGEALHEEMDRQVKQTIAPDGKVDTKQLRANNRVQSAKQGRASTLTIAEFKALLETSIAKTGSTVAIAIHEIITSKRTPEQALSFLADFGPEDFEPADGSKPTAKRGRKAKSEAAPAAAKPTSGKRTKIGANTPAPVVGGEVAPVADESAPVLPEGVRLPPKRTGGRTKRNVAPVDAPEQVELATAEIVTSEPSEPANDSPVLADATADVDPEPVF